MFSAGCPLGVRGPEGTPARTGLLPTPLQTVPCKATQVLDLANNSGMKSIKIGAQGMPGPVNCSPHVPIPQPYPRTSSDPTLITDRSILQDGW